MNTAMSSHLSHNDPILARLIELYGKDIRTLSQTNSTNFIEELCETIVSQQLSVKAAATIWGRAKNAVKDWDNPVLILECDDTTLRQAGLSGQKVSYVKNIARAVLEGTLHPSSYLQLPEQEIIDELVKVKGIGVWTAEMFLIFSLGREDVFSIGDLGLRNAIKKHYGDLDATAMQELSLAWSPYRSYASLLLWKSLDNEPLKT